MAPASARGQCPVMLAASRHFARRRRCTTRHHPAPTGTTLTTTPMMRRLCYSAVAVTLLVATPFRGVAAQTFPTDDPVLKRIWAIGMDSSRTMELSSALLDSIGPRLAGSPGQKRAQDWLVKTYASMGVTAKNEQYGTWRGWRRGWSHVDLVSP